MLFALSPGKFVNIDMLEPCSRMFCQLDNRQMHEHCIKNKIEKGGKKYDLLDPG